MKNLETTLSTILGEDYEETKTFFYNVITVKCPYKVFLTRRAFVLYKLFQTVFGNEIEAYGKMYNTHSLPLLKNTEQGKILIVDDIIVHGRTMTRIVDKLQEWNIDKTRIVLWCIRCNSKACNLEKLKPFLKHVIYVMPEQWEKFSDTLTKSIVASNVGYISFVDSYRVEDIDFSNISTWANQLNLQVLSNTAEHFTRYAIESKILWGNFSRKDIVDKYNITPCIRIYKMGEEELLIPYVFMPSLCVDKVYLFCRSLLKDFGINEYPAIFDNQDPDILALFYKWTTNKISFAFLESFVKEYELNFERKLNICKEFECSESYAFECECVDNTSMEYSKVDLEGELSTNVASDKCLQLMSRLLSQLKCIQDFPEIFSEYISSMRSMDNELAKNGDDRLLGIQVSDILALIKHKLKLEETSEIQNVVMSIIIGAWDCGRCAYVIEAIKTTDGENIASCLIRHGEQSFTAYYSRHKGVFNVFYEFFEQTHEIREKQLVAFAKYFDRVFDKTGFSQFVKNLDLETYYADMKTVSPDNYYDGSIVHAENVKKEVTYYVRNYYEG